MRFSAAGMRSKKAFILVVLALVAVVAVWTANTERLRLSLPRRTDLRVTLAKEQIDMLLRCIDLYRVDCGTYPPATNGFGPLLRSDDKGWRGPYVTTQNLVDPWGQPFLYELTDGTPKVVSSGRDKRYSTWDDVTGSIGSSGVYVFSVANRAKPGN